nr:CoA transferase [Ramlibacter algicola]
MPDEALRFADLAGSDPVYPSSFAIGTAAQASVAAAALAAAELGHLRGQPRQRVAVDMAQAATECTAWFAIDGQAPDLWDPFSGLYRCADGWVRVHANFRHHRDGALRLLALDPATATREQAEQAMARWKALDYEEASARARLVATALRTFAQWDATPQGQAVASQPLVEVERMGDAPVLALPELPTTQRPLEGVKVLDLTRILAGPVAGRALAAYGADVMLVNSPHLPNIDAIADTSRGKRSCHVDLTTAEGRATFDRLLSEAHVLIQGYRPGGLDALGYGPEALARKRPGLVAIWLSAYGRRGPWAERRGFDSLVQTAMGFNHAEGEAAGGGPKPLPMQILDEATGLLMAAMAASLVHRQQREGGSWLARLSLAQTGHWLRSLGRVERGLSAQPPSRERWVETVDSGFGRLSGITHSAILSATPARWTRPSVPPGDSPPRW